MFKAKYYPYSHKNFLLKSASSQENRDCFFISSSNEKCKLNCLHEPLAL